MSKRLSRPNILGEGAEALIEHHSALEADFREFFPAVIEFARGEAMCSGQQSLVVVASATTHDGQVNKISGSHV